MKLFTEHNWKVARKWLIAGASIAILWAANQKIAAIKLAVDNLAAPDTVVVMPIGGLK